MLYDLFSCDCLPPIPRHRQVWWPLSPSQQCQRWGPVSISSLKAHKLSQGKGQSGTIPSGSLRASWFLFPALDGQGCLPREAQGVAPPHLQAGGGLDSQAHPLAWVSPVSGLSRVKPQEASVLGTRFQGCASVLLPAGAGFCLTEAGAGLCFASVLNTGMFSLGLGRAHTELRCFLLFIWPPPTW